MPSPTSRGTTPRRVRAGWPGAWAVVNGTIQAALDDPTVAGLKVHEGTVAGWVTDSTRSDNFVDFLADLVAQTPAGLDLHCIADNLSAHKTDKVTEFLTEHPQVHVHYTPTHASWLNQVELFFSILERRLLRRGEFDSVDDLAQRIIAFIKDYNRRAAPFRWTYDGRPLIAA
jgi:transposase